MEVRRVELPLTGFGVSPTTAIVELQQLSKGERVKRAGVSFGLGLLLALIALPIPLVHFVLVPASLLAGTVLGLVRARQDQIIRTAQGSCPFCGAEQRFTTSARFKLPKKLNCDVCHRQLLLEPTSEPPRSPT